MRCVTKVTELRSALGPSSHRFNRVLIQVLNTLPPSAYIMLEAHPKALKVEFAGDAVFVPHLTRDILNSLQSVFTTEDNLDTVNL